MRRAFTLIEMLVVIALIGLMAGFGAVSIVSGRGAAQVKGATRDVFAAIRHARSLALVTGQRVLVNFSNEKVDDEVALKVEVVAAKIMNTDADRPAPTPYYVMDYKDLPQQKTGLVNIREPMSGKTAEVQQSNGGETIEEILFSPMNTDVIKGMRILVKKGEEALEDETAAQTRSRISVFSNVDYLQNRYKEAKQEAQAKEEGESSSAEATEDVGGSSGSVNDMDGEVSVVWETNGSVEPHKIWIYPDGRKPEDGLMVNVDRFGAIKVLDGDGKDDEE